MPKLNALTSLRFFAAFAVVLFHVPYVLPSAGSNPIMPDGALAVGFFFVLSGFILAHAHPPRTPLAATRFYWKRFARIYPLHALTLIVWCLLFFSSWGNPLPERINSGIANVTLTQAFFSGPVFNLGFNAVAWSLSVEAFFYLLFPVVRLPAIAASVIVAHVVLSSMLDQAAVDALYATMPDFFYFNPLARLAEFCTGILAYSAFLRLKSLPSGSIAEVAAIALVILAVVFRQVAPLPLMYPALGLSFALVIAVFARQEGLTSRALTWWPLVLLGEASFSLYLTHHMWFRVVQQSGLELSGPSLLIVATGSAIALSVFLYLIFERPVQRLLLSGKFSIPNGLPMFRPRPKDADV